MKYDSDRNCYIVDDPYVVNTLKSANETLLTTCDHIMKSICLAINTPASDISSETIIHSLREHMNHISLEDKKQFEKLLVGMNGIYDHIDMKKLLDHMTTRTFDPSPILRTLDDKTTILCSHMDRNTHTLHSTLESMKQKSTQDLGSEGQDDLIAALETKLTHREGYSIHNTSGQSYGCDIEIRREGYVPIRIEVKNHRSSIRQKEVEKFHRDAGIHNTHAIFVSLHSDIVGKGPMEIERLPTGRLAVYLSNNRYDIYVIYEMIRLFHTLDPILNYDQQTISTDSIKRINDYMNGIAVKVKSVIAQMNTSIETLKSIDTKYIQTIIQSDIEDKPEHICPHCSKTYKSKKGLEKHMASKCRTLHPR